MFSMDWQSIFNSNYPDHILIKNGRTKKNIAGHTKAKRGKSLFSTRDKIGSN